MGDFTLLTTKFTPLFNPLSLSLAIGISSFSGSAFASEELPSVSLDTVVVTASRSAQTVDQSTSTVAVITREEIESSQARSVPELLENRAGLFFASNGGRGKASSLFMRGTNSDHVVVLIDGVKVGSATSGSVAFADIPVEQIERIEVVRGARSSLYGSEAIGGVIQIFTRKGSKDLKRFASASVGSQDTWEGSVGASGATGNFNYALSASGITTSGYDTCRAEADGVGGCYNNEPDKDGYESFSGNLRAGYQFGANQISVFALQTQNKNEFDGNYQNSSESTQRAVGVTTDLQLSDAYFIRLQAGQSADLADNYLDEAYSSQFDTLRETVSLQNDVTIGSDVLLSFGADYQRDEVDSTVVYAENAKPVNERENIGSYIQGQARFGGLTAELSGRLDDNEQYGAHRTFGLGLGWKVSDKLRFIASHGKAFKAPTFNQLYYPFFGSPDLNPEESRTTELGARISTDIQTWGITVFKTTIDNLIAYDSSIFAANNIDEASITGLELELDHRFSQQWTASLDLTLMEPENKSESYDGNQLARRPQRAARFDLSYQGDGWSAGSTVNLVGSRYDDVANTKRLSAYKTFDLRVAKAITSEWEIQARVENLSDTDYETAQFYVQPERNLLFTVRYQPE